MSKLKFNIERPAKYLDKILLILSENFYNYLTVQDIQNILTPIEIFGEAGNVTFGEELLLDLRNALAYLISQKLVQINPGNNQEFTLTFEGYIKIKTKGFQQEINEKSLNQTLQRLSWTVPMIISIIALLVAIFKNTANPEKKIINHFQQSEKVI
jgi:hypothetical protein